ncbi:MAG: DNA polymerase III subunit alpha [Flavobacterium sp. BFFFF2]|nr:MAG: DNA polymerase III subunit alpha [Flavobacterium sp. BFFFF2]
MYLIFDTETTGLPKNWSAPITDTNNWPRCVQLAWQLHDEWGVLLEHHDFLIRPDGYNIPFDAERIHGISTELAMEQGVSLQEAMDLFVQSLAKSKFIVGQNIGFDVNILGCELVRLGMHAPLSDMPVLDTCTETTAQLLKLPGGKGGKFKLPTLTELHDFLFQVPFAEAHNATADVEATARCFFELLRRRLFNQEELAADSDYLDAFIGRHPVPFKAVGLQHINLKQASEALKQKRAQPAQSAPIVPTDNNTDWSDFRFTHLHNHTQFSVLQSTMNIGDLVKGTIKQNMPAVALTDHANLMGAFQFVRDILGHNKKVEQQLSQADETGEEVLDSRIKPIVGCEFYVCENRLDKTRKDNGYQVVFLAKNKRGYHHLAKLSSIAYTEGFYYVPRIDRESILQYKEDLIVLSGALNGEISSKILNVGENQAEEALLWWKETFGADFYLEVIRHQQDDENHVNEVLRRMGAKHEVKLVASNNVFYLNQNDAQAHDILLCVRDGEKVSTPIGRGRGYRYGLPNQEFYFKSTDEMKQLFHDWPEALLHTQEIVDKIEIYNLSRDVLLPKFDIPDEFQVAEDESDQGKRGENNYLKHLSFLGAAKRYGELTPEIQDRLDFELKTIEKTGYPGYFLIVQDFIAAAREMGVSVGPGRGSAAGSAVAYCLGITNIDPIKYDLLFERFLNPDRVSMPDIDIDFDDEGRGRVMDYVINKYGSKQVAQIITYGTMAAKSSIRDTARVLDLSLADADRIAKLIPNNMTLEKILTMAPDKLKAELRAEDLDKAKALKAMAEGNDLVSETIQQAKMLEGNLRNTGIHACGVIITPDDITNFVPVATAKDSDLYVTQFDNAVVESAGLLKMDFLGLKTLTLIKDTVKLVKYRTGIELDPDAFPIDDVKTYELFQRGETVGIFQYESAGMQKYLKELKPTVFGDLIAMNALYRPGPLEYIPAFIRRKNGEEPIEFDLEANEEYLSETYGITVYQEQVMLLSQKLASFSKGDADVLRKAMGKKQKDVLDKMKSKFITQAVDNGHAEDKLEKIWRDWEAFAQYAFNKSHSTCYAWIAYQTAYLKAHYPAEYMAAVLSNNMNDIKQVSFFMEECRRMGLQVLGPDVNESFYKFTVNEHYAIRFGIGAVKGVGSNAVETIVENRKKKPYTSIFDLAKRIDLRAANKKAIENLALAGGFDCFSTIHRAQYFHKEGDEILFLEKAMRFGAKFQENENSSQVSLFGESSDIQIPEPQIPSCDEWTTMHKLAQEKEVVGIYISGHPLDDYKYELKSFCNVKLDQLSQLETLVGKNVSFAGIVTQVQYKTARNGKDWATFVLEGYEDSHEFRIFDEDYLKFRHFLVQNHFVFVKVLVRDGWVNRETGKKSEPRIQFQEIKLLQDIMPVLTKKLTFFIDIKELVVDRITTLHDLLKQHSGDIPIHFELLEVNKKVQTPKAALAVQTEESEQLTDELPDFMEVVEEVQVITRLALSCRRMRITVSRELLHQLEMDQWSFKIN